jgi:hypothetical protein
MEAVAEAVEVANVRSLVQPNPFANSKLLVALLVQVA